MRETLKIYGHEVWDRPWLVIGGMISSFIYFISGDIVVPIFMARLVDAIIKSPPDFHAAYIFLWGIVGAELMAFVSARLSFVFRNPSLSTATKNITLQIFNAYERQEHDFFTNSFVGSLVARSSRFISTFKELYDTILFSFSGLLIELVLPVIILTQKSRLLGLTFSAAALVVFLATIILGRYKTPHLRRAAAAESEVTAGLADVLSNNLATRVFARHDYEYDRFERLADKRRRLFDIQTRVAERIRAARSIAITIFQVSVAYVLVRLTQNHVITVGTILLAQLYLTKLAQGMWDMNRLIERLEESLADAAEMTEIMLRKPRITDPVLPHPFHPTRGEIELKNVEFTYQEKDMQQEVLFHSLNLRIPPGEKVGLVGPSGGGKTTLTKLLLRFMDINSGEILIDGENIAAVKQDDLRSHIAYVPQEPILFHRTIRENISYGDPTADEPAIIRAAELAHAHGFIKQLPQGYDTMVGERGVKLSGGEKQRIAIARAMLKKSPVLILDEATSALDSKSEKAIVAALDNLMRSRTTIVIAHRLSTIRKLDRIIVLKEGQLVEDGTHQGLIAQKGLYAELWQHQSGEFLGEELD